MPVLQTVSRQSVQFCLPLLLLLSLPCGPIPLCGPLVSPSSFPSNLDSSKAAERRTSKAGVSREGSRFDFSKVDMSFMKKIPPGAEASNVLVGEVDFLEKPIIAFVRLSPAVLITGLTEIFHDVAYKAKDRTDLLSGIDEFLDQVTVLPPGEWDPTIRIEPPKNVPSQMKRKQSMQPNGLASPSGDHENEEDQHTGPELQRTGRIFGGLVWDIKRKLPFYWSDLRDALSLQCLASVLFLYCACMSPVITFGGLLGEATKGNISAIESLFGASLTGVAYSLFAGQPLTILGSTGPVLVFEKILFKFCTSLVCYITRFTEEAFAALICIIFIYEALEKLFHLGEHYPVNTHGSLDNLTLYSCQCSPPANASADQVETWNRTGYTPDTVPWDKLNISMCNLLHGEFTGAACGPHGPYIPDVLFWSVILFFTTFFLSSFLKHFKTERYFPTRVRSTISDFAVFITIMVMVLVDYLMGIPSPKLNVPDRFEPTSKNRGWLMDPLGPNPWWTLLVAALPALLCTILIFMDQQITAVIINRKEHKLKSAIESLFGASLTGVAYSLFAGQPLTILGSTGPVLVFEKILFKFCTDYGLSYLSLRTTIGLWTAFLCLVLVATDASSLVCYITRFTEEAFAALICIIFIYEALEKLFHLGEHYPVNTHGSLDNLTLYSCQCSPPANASADQVETWNRTGYTPDTVPWDKLNISMCNLLHGEFTGAACGPHGPYIPDVLFWSVILFFTTFFLSSFLKHFKTERYFPTRRLAVFITIMVMVLVDYLMGIPSPKLNVPGPASRGCLHTFVQPRPHSHLQDRGLADGPTGPNPWWTLLVAALPALLCTILIFMDQQITAVIINRKEHKLKKGCGYHLDLLIVAIMLGVCSIMGLPWFVAATVLSISHVNSLKVESGCSAPGEQPKFLGIREQRVTGFLIFMLMGCSVFMTSVLKFIPMPVLYGVFLYMGVSSLKGIQFFDRIKLFSMPAKHQPDLIYLRYVPLWKVHVFTLVQLTCLVLLWVIKATAAAVVFPMMVLALVFIRKLLDFFFTKRELSWLDDLIPESKKKKEDDKKKREREKREAQSRLEEEEEGLKVHFDDDINHLSVPVKTLSGRSYRIGLVADTLPVDEDAPAFSLIQRSVCVVLVSNH
ncbi:hypothetical protein CRUP_024339 [Coryphaenoides rupestris]|nr:hypothetical protein CRUP_024339 [Coryphaenoides rupestris]